jgi:DNA-binding transcriptional LysR family regulator
MAVELRHVRYFIAVAEEGHITRAAERLGMQQPPLSQQIKAMERELDVQLFRRKPRGVELTDAGRALLEDAREILARLDQALETTRRTARGEQGRIRVGISVTSTFHPLVPRAIRAFREAYPLVFLTLQEGRTHDLVELLRGERIDAAFVRLPPADPDGVAVNNLLEEPMVLALPSAHVLARGSRSTAIPLKSLANETFIAPPSQRGPGLRATAFEAYRAAGFAPRIGQEDAGTTTALSFVAAGLGISIVPASLQRLRIDGVAYRRLEGAARLTAPLTLVSRRGDPSAVVRHFLALARKAALKFVAE